MSIDLPSDGGQQPANPQSIKNDEKEEYNVIGVNVLNQNGVNVPEIIKLLVYNGSVEFTAYYYFTNLRMHCTWL